MKKAAKKSQNNYFSKPRRSVNLWVIYVKRWGEKVYFPVSDLRGRTIAYASKRSAQTDLYVWGRCIGPAYLQKVGPIS